MGFLGDVERSKKYQSRYDCRDGQGLGVSPSTLLLLEREEDQRDIKKYDSLLIKATPQQTDCSTDHQVVVET